MTHPVVALLLQIAAFDELMTEFIREHNVPGAAIAVARGGEIVHAGAYGEVDDPDALFRIASLSKPITAVAIMRLVAEKKLALDDKLVDYLSGDRWSEITLRQLLQHRAGFDRDKSGDPMFMSARICKELGEKGPATPEQIIRWMRERPLDFAPGERYAYSNFGYCLLGRVIEKVSGATYEPYVQSEILKPLGVTRMRIGSDERADGEVEYHGKSAYGAWSVEAMDAHGGWIASAPDLVRFALSADGPPEMYAPPAGEEKAEVFYACGWSVRPVGERFNAWHTGALDGTSTLLVRRHDGLVWAVLFNQRAGKDGRDLAALIDPLVHRAAAKAWPR